MCVTLPLTIDDHLELTSSLLLPVVLSLEQHCVLSCFPIGLPWKCNVPIFDWIVGVDRQEAAIGIHSYQGVSGQLEYLAVGVKFYDLQLTLRATLKVGLSCRRQERTREVQFQIYTNRLNISWLNNFISYNFFTWFVFTCLQNNLLFLFLDNTVVVNFSFENMMRFKNKNN